MSFPYFFYMTSLWILGWNTSQDLPSLPSEFFVPILTAYMNRFFYVKIRWNRIFKIILNGDVTKRWFIFYTFLFLFCLCIFCNIYLHIVFQIHVLSLTHTHIYIYIDEFSFISMSFLLFYFAMLSTVPWCSGFMVISLIVPLFINVNDHFNHLYFSHYNLPLLPLVASTFNSSSVTIPQLSYFFFFSFLCSS